MNLYDDVTVVGSPPALPAAGATPGYFSDGQIGGQARTTIRAWILNAMMTEIVHVVQQAGLAPTRADNTQLYQAIMALMPPTLGYTPVQQGGGPSQGTNKIRLGWDVAGTGLRLEIDNTDLGQIALKTDLATAITNLIGGAPGALDTLNELAASINDETNYAAAVTQALALKAPLAAPALTEDGNGNYPTTPTPPVNDTSTKIANMAVLQVALQALKPQFFGTAQAGARWDPRDGWLEQWGELDQAISTEGDYTVNFPYTFDTCLGALGEALDAGSTTDSSHVQRGAYTTSSCVFRVQDSAGNSQASTTGIAWRAWGFRATAP